MLAAEIAEISQEARKEGSWRSLSGSFWRFFSVALCFDVGFGLYFFLINLYLAELKFDAKIIGMVAAALTVGNLVATLPTGLVARRVGPRSMLMFCFVAAPLLAAARVIAFHPAAQVALAFAQGVAMCGYTVCFAPAITALTTPENRTTAFSLIFGTGIGSGVFCGLLGGAAPGLLCRTVPSLARHQAMGVVLAVGCGFALFSIVRLMRLRFPVYPRPAASPLRAVAGSFVWRFLCMVAVWNIAIGAFAPFASIYLSGQMHIALSSIGVVFSASQLLQVGGVLSAPLLYRSLGKQYGIAGAQFAACGTLILLGFAPTRTLAIVAYLCLSVFQYMCNPALYSVLMECTREDLRETASALQNLVTSGAVAIASAAAGLLITRCGYGAMFACAACCALAAGVLAARLRDERQADGSTDF